MYEYSEESLPLNPLCVPDNVKIVLETTPTEYPYVARICANRGYVLIWSTDRNKYPTIDYVKGSEGEDQTFWDNDPNKLEYGLCIVYPYDTEVIIGTLKYYGYMSKLGRTGTNKIIKELWNDIIMMFGDRKIICPSGTYFEILHLLMNQCKIPRNSYKKSLMKSLGFIRDGDYWIRNANLLA